MKNIEEVEKLISEKRNLMTDLSRKATDSLRSEILDLEREKRRLSIEKNLYDFKMLDDVLPIINRISSKVIKLNASGKFTIWMDFSGHVKKFEVRGYKGPYIGGHDDEFRHAVYLDTNERTSAGDIIESLNEIEGEIDKLETQDDW